MSERALSAALLSLLLLGSGGGCGEDEPSCSQACEGDQGCPAGQACRPGGDGRRCVPTIACHASAECGPAAVCRKPVGACEASGSCYPVSCQGRVSGVAATVCGCDGQDYGNEDIAELAGSSIAFVGPCALDGVSCSALEALFSLSRWEGGSGICSQDSSCRAKTVVDACGCHYPLSPQTKGVYADRLQTIANALKERCVCTASVASCATSADQLACNTQGQCTKMGE